MFYSSCMLLHIDIIHIYLDIMDIDESVFLQGRT